MKKVVVALLCFLSAFALCLNVSAKKAEEKVVAAKEEPAKVTVHIFSKDGCPHCAEAKEYLSSLLKTKEFKGKFALEEHQVWDASWAVDKSNKKLLDEIAVFFKEKEEINGAPYIVVSNNYSVNGFAETLKEEISNAINAAYEDEEYFDIVKLTMENGNVLPEEYQEKKSPVGTIIGSAVVVVVIAGLVCLIVFSRKEN